jgi:hypothetical protein
MMGGGTTTPKPLRHLFAQYLSQEGMMDAILMMPVC